MPELTLKTVTRTQGNNRALKEGLVKPAHYHLAFEEYPVLVDAFRLMVRELKFDVCEMAITTYLCARAHGKAFTAIPVPLVRGFHAGAILVRKNSGITHPKELEGKRVGVNRGYTVTTGVWARAALARDYGVDLSKITFVLSGDEHVAEYRAPANVIPMDKSRTMAEHLLAGDLAATIGAEIDHPDITALIPNALEAGLTALRANGYYYPINHLVVIKDDLIAKHPGLATDIFNAFAQSKQLYLRDLKAGTLPKPDAADKLAARVGEILPDPLPYGVEPNRRIIAELIDNALSQGIITQPVTVDSIFVPETLGLLG